MQIVWNAKTSSFYISSRSFSCLINYRRRPPRLCYSLSKKTHNWDPFKILIPTCRIICFLLIFALTSSLQGLSVLVMGLDGIQCHWNCCTNTAVCLQIIINKDTLQWRQEVTCPVTVLWFWLVSSALFFQTFRIKVLQHLSACFKLNLHHLFKAEGINNLSSTNGKTYQWIMSLWHVQQLSWDRKSRPSVLQCSAVLSSNDPQTSCWATT